MNNSVIFTENDKFSSKTTTRSHQISFQGGLYFYYISFRHVSAPEIDTLLVDVDFHGTGWMHIKDGELVFHINGTKNICLKAHDQGTGIHSTGGTVDESAYYEITKEEFEELCEAKTVEIKLSGAHNYDTQVCNDLIINTARAMYNAIYDSSKYKSVVNQIEKKKQAEQAAAENKRNESRMFFAVALICAAVAFFGFFYALYKEDDWWIPICGAVGCVVSVVKLLFG